MIVAPTGENPHHPFIRLAQQHDVPAIAGIMAGDPLWQRYGVTVDSATRRLQAGLDAGAAVAVVDVGGSIAGFVWYVQKGAFQRSGYIMLLGVACHWQAQGVGKALLEYAEADLLTGSDSILLLVSDFNTAAQGFYRRYGYVQIGAIPDYVIPGVTEWIFFKRGERE